jgi:hypothetical protein
VTNVDPVTGHCDDPYIQTTLSAGVDYLGLSVWDNVPSTNFLADGYRQTGNLGFTCVEVSMSGQFCDVTATVYGPRTGDWAFILEGVDHVTDVSTPEPSTGWPILWGSLLGTWPLRRRSAWLSCL